MNASDDELEQQLRALYSDSRLGVEPPADAASAIVAGAQRRRRRRKALISASGAVCVLAAVSVGLFLVKVQTTDTTADLAGPPPKVPSVTPASSSSAPTSASDAPVPVVPSAEEPSPTAIRSTSAPRKPPPPASSTPPVTPMKVTKGPLLTADGLGSLKLGMTQQQLTDEGLTLTPVKESAGCTYYSVAGAGVPAATAVLSRDAGVVVVKPDGAAHTPEGVGAGSAKEDVTAAYPDTAPSSDGLVAPTTDGAYHFTLTTGGSVSSIDVRTTTHPCTD